MNASLTLNPLSVVEFVRKDGEPVALNIRCFARRRSFQRIRVEKAEEPRLFSLLLNWIEGKSPTETLDIEEELRLWRKGLFISPGEYKAVPPEVRPDIDKGHRIASALCPGIADLLRDGPRLPPLRAPDEMFAAKSYCTVPPLIAQADVAALNLFYDSLLDGDWLELNTRESKRYVIHNDPAARRVQAALTPFFSALTGQALKPSYTYASEYCDNSGLARHTDRPQCEVTFSLYLDYRPAPAGQQSPWPLIVQTSEGDVPCYQPRGGGTLIRGRVLPHYREPLPPGHRARMVFFHYVSTSFEGSLG